MHYYQLKYMVTLISKDAALTSNNIANQSTQPLKLNTAFSAYPNPAKNSITVQLNGRADFILSDQSGKTLLRKPIGSNGPIEHQI